MKPPDKEDGDGRCRVLFLTDSGAWGGVECVLLILARALDPRDVQASFVVGTRGLLLERLQGAGIPTAFIPMEVLTVPRHWQWARPLVYAAGFLRLTQRAVQVAREVRRQRPEILHASSLQSELTGAFAAAVCRCRLVWHTQAIPPPGLKRFCLRLIARHTSVTIAATSNAVADAFGPALRHKVSVIRAGIPDPRPGVGDKRACRTRILDSEGIRGGALVLFASMILRAKGFHIFVAMANQVLESCGNVTFLVAGEARHSKNQAYLREVMASPQAVRLGDRLRLLGFREDVHDLIQGADCLVHCPTDLDALPTVVLEAMALSTPVVGSRIGGVPEQILDGDTGFLVEPGDTGGVSARVVEILRNPVLAARLGSNARQRYLEHFTAERFTWEMRALYKTLQ